MEIIALERAALEKWNQGDPSSYLALYSKRITYFDPLHPKRLDGFDVMEKYYESVRGKIHVDKYEIIDPVVEVCGDMAVLSYNLRSCSGEEETRWNCTEVYYKEENDQWKIIHNHWSNISVQ